MSPVELMSQWSFSGIDWLVIGLGVTVAYIVFGIAGFGTALVAVPILILYAAVEDYPVAGVAGLCRGVWRLASNAARFEQAETVAVAALHGHRLHLGRGVFAQPALGPVAAVDGAV